MGYQFEDDELRQELRQGVAKTVRIWPKYQGVGNVSAHATANTFEVFDGAGESLQGPTAIAPVAVTVEYGTISRFDVPVAAIGTLGEDLRIDLRWTYSGVVQLTSVFFDVVLYPLGSPSVTLNDVLEERPDAGDILERMGDVLGLTNAKESMAAKFALRALVELDAKIRAHVADEFTLNASASLPVTPSPFTRPNLILNRERLNRVERKLTMKLLYAAEMKGPDDDSESSALYRYYKDESESAWASVGPLKYDRSEDQVVDRVVPEIGRVVHLRRVQG